MLTWPIGQAVHELAPVSFANEPAAQATQTVLLEVFVNDPARHGAHGVSELLVKLPGWQDVQLDALSAEYEPLGQRLHGVVPFVARPAVQAVHADHPGRLKLPTAHAGHAVLSCTAVYVPAEQLAHG